MQPNFKDIEANSLEIERNEFFSQFTNHQIPNHYDANFILLHYNPTLTEFQMIEKMHLEYQVSIEQAHLHFYWPENTGIFVDLLDYLNEENYEMGMEELLHIRPAHFKVESQNKQIFLNVIDKEQLDNFLSLNYKEDLLISEYAAEHKADVYSYQFKQPNTQFILASIDDRPVGSLILISSENYLEVDNVLTDQDYRKLGVATRLLEYVMEVAEKEVKEVILLADAEDTPKEMYLKQGFSSIATRIHAQKVKIEQ